MPERRPRLPARAAVAAAVAGGGALVLAFPPVGWWPLAPLGPALLVLAVVGRRPRATFGLGLLFGVVFYLPLLSWLRNLGLLPWLALAGVETVGMALFALAVRALLRLRAWPLLVAAAWVGYEAARDRVPFGGFPWGRLAFSQADSPALRWVSVGGAPWLTFVVAAVGAVLAWLIVSRRRIAPAMGLLAAVGVAMSALLLPAADAASGTTGGNRVDVGESPSATTVIAVVQGNVPRARTLADQVRAASVTRNHAEQTHLLAAQVRAGRRPAPTVVIWPENSTDVDPGADPRVAALIQSAVDDINRPVLVGAVLDAPGGRGYNAGQLWLPHRGPVATYAKRHLVPFGEYVPFRSWLQPWIPQLSLVPRDDLAGQTPRLFRIGDVRLGDVICYEVAYDGLVRSTVTTGANLLAVQTNDATYERDGQTGETEQQLAMARLRAVEHDREVVVASTTGVSALIRPDGSVAARTGLFEPALLDNAVALREDTTLADRVGAGPELGLSAVALIGLAAAVVAPRVRRRRAATVVPAEATERSGDRTLAGDPH